jgi:hypothetical protein
MGLDSCLETPTPPIRRDRLLVGMLSLVDLFLSLRRIQAGNITQNEPL